VRSFLAVMASAVALRGCAQMIAQQAMNDAQEKFAKCAADNMATPEGHIGQFQADLAQGHADAVRADEVQRQRLAEAMIRSGALTAATKPQVQTPRAPRKTTTNSTWLGNNLNCTSM